MTYLYCGAWHLIDAALLFCGVFQICAHRIFMRAVADHQTAPKMGSPSSGCSPSAGASPRGSASAASSSATSPGGGGAELYRLKVCRGDLRGLDSILAPSSGGLVVGLLEFLSAGYLDPYIPAINEVFPFIVLVLVLMIRPYGCLESKNRTGVRDNDACRPGYSMKTISRMSASSRPGL